MKTLRALFAVLLVLTLCPSLHAQIVNGRLVASFFTWENFDTVGSSKTYLRGLQAVQLSGTYGDVSLHTYILGSMNAAQAFGDYGFLRVYNLYLRWSGLGKMLDINAGRHAVFAGVGNGTIDGLSMRARLFQEKVQVTGYWGSTVCPQFTGVRENWHDNQNFGAQILTTALPDLRIGASYMNRREERDPYWALRARDTTLLPYPYLIQFESMAEQYLSGDATYAYGKVLTVYGRYDYDLNNAQTSRAQGSMRINVTDALSVTGDCIYRVPRIAYNSIFSAFVTNSTTEVEGGIEYSFLPLLRAFARIGDVTYSGETSQRWTVGVNAGYGTVSYSGSDGYAGELQSLNLYASYPLFNNLLIPNGGIAYSSYRLKPEDQRRDAVSVVLGAMVRPSAAFSCDLQGQWLTNKVYNQDLRLQAKLSYWFSHRF
jgi:hypothetical protein